MSGIKTAEFRSRPTKIIGERFYIYAAMKPGPDSEFAKVGCEPGDLPTGVIIGTAKITHCTKTRDGWAWHQVLKLRVRGFTQITTNLVCSDEVIVNRSRSPHIR